MGRLSLVILFFFSGLGMAWGEDTDPPNRDDGADPPGLHYLVSDGAVPFIYGSAAVTLGLHFFAEPPEEPRLFSPDDGGLESDGDTVPELAVAGYALAGGAFVALDPGAARWQHLKGYTEAIATTLALTEVAKNVFGRRRPHFDSDSTSLDLRRSFFSGHASVTAATSTYLGLYLRNHAFARARGDSFLPWWEAGTYLAFGAATAAVLATRVTDNRHHVSDVIAGAAVGSATAAAFYGYHELLFRERREEDALRTGARPMLLPDIENRGLVLVGFF